MTPVGKAQSDGWEQVAHKKPRARLGNRTVENLPMEAMSLAEKAPAPREEPLHKRIARVTGVHRDDIHCLLKLPNQTFISGSKDGSLRQWNFSGDFLREVYTPGRIDYKSWITAAAVLDEDRWVSGTRDAYIDRWRRSSHQMTFPAEFFPRPDPKCKDRNRQRVHCLAPCHFQEKVSLFFAGWGTQFTLHNAESGQLLSTCITSPNDWVYSLLGRGDTSVLAVTGARLDAWKMSDDFQTWERTRTLIEEPLTKEGYHLPQRPYISAMTPLDLNPHLLGLAVFDGSVHIYDIEQGATVGQPREHRKRVWMVENTTPSCFASCGDDGLIKFWDLRALQRSIWTVKDNLKEKARVSVLLRLDENTLVSGSCPDDSHQSEEKAAFSFWDLRN